MVDRQIERAPRRARAPSPHCAWRCAQERADQAAVWGLRRAPWRAVQPVLMFLTRASSFVRQADEVHLWTCALPSHHGVRGEFTVHTIHTI